jgi:hypothetical protein
MNQLISFYKVNKKERSEKKIEPTYSSNKLTQFGVTDGESNTTS